MMDATDPRVEPTRLTERFGRALAEALRLHGDQERKGSRVPYVGHLLGTAGIVLHFGGTETQAIAALLHDAAEDCGGRPTLDRIRDRAGALTGVGFNAVLLNLYRDGRDGMGWHADDEPELGRNPVIASVSLGAERRFCLRHRRRRDLKVDLLLPQGSLLCMSGATQHHWLHALPKTRRPVGERINLTFRQVGVR
jgi:hypothetical protein